MNGKLLYRVTEVAAILSLSRSTVYELVLSGVLPSVRIGGSRRIRGEDLARYVDSLERVGAVVSCARRRRRSPRPRRSLGRRRGCGTG